MRGRAGVDPRGQQVDGRALARALDELGAPALLGPLLGPGHGVTVEVTPPSPAAARTTSSEVIGVGHEPKVAMGAERMTSNSRRCRRGAASVPRSVVNPHDMCHMRGSSLVTTRSPVVMITAVDCSTCGTRNAPGVATCVGCGRPWPRRARPPHRRGRRTRRRPRRPGARRRATPRPPPPGGAPPPGGYPPGPGGGPASRRIPARRVPTRIPAARQAPVIRCTALPRRVGAVVATRACSSGPSSSSSPSLGRRCSSCSTRAATTASRWSSSRSTWCRRTTSPGTSTPASRPARSSPTSRRTRTCPTPAPTTSTPASPAGPSSAPSRRCTAAAATPRCATSGVWSRS